MLKFLQIYPLLGLLISFSYAQESKKHQDKESIKSMCGCYAITFEYAETFRNDTAYQFHDRYVTGASAEWVFVDEETEDKVVIQHLLVARDTIVIKHWRQDWIYENTDLYAYEKNHHWIAHDLSSAKVEGQWTQKVYQVDDGPRYGGTGTWIHEDGKHFWESKADAPLPRREYTKRSDYNIMHRRNRHQITDKGWVHEQDNKKIIRQDGQDSVLVEEKGVNTYTKIDDDNCEAAQEWWENNKGYWRLVRDVWDDIYESRDNLNFQLKVDGKKRYEKLFHLQKQYHGKRDQKMKKQIRQVITSYLTEGGSNSQHKQKDAY